jgi:uncharacterized protein YbjT (DUF2867 family)
MSSAAGHKERSRVLVIGGTGYIGRFIVAASAREGHPTYVLVRDPAPADPAKQWRTQPENSARAGRYIHIPN